MLSTLGKNQQTVLQQVCGDTSTYTGIYFHLFEYILQLFQSTNLVRDPLIVLLNLLSRNIYNFFIRHVLD